MNRQRLGVGDMSLGVRAVNLGLDEGGAREGGGDGVGGGERGAPGFDVKSGWHD
jgi:hypothetical protein